MIFHHSLTRMHHTRTRVLAHRQSSAKLDDDTPGPFGGREWKDEAWSDCESSDDDPDDKINLTTLQAKLKSKKKAI